MAVQVPAEDWGDGGIMNWLRDEMNSNPDIVPSFLELLRVLPEVHAILYLFTEESFLLCLSLINIKKPGSVQLQDSCSS